MALKVWVKLPSVWIEEKRLREFRWARGEGANNVAALMTLMVIAHHADDHGRAELTYDSLATCTGLSRSKISAGLNVLEQKNLMKRDKKRSGYLLSDFDPNLNWAKFPARFLYGANGRISAFNDFKLRSSAELHALKLYFLFASRRDRRQNAANISYNKITDYSGVEAHYIRRALSILALNGLVYVERQSSWVHEDRTANAYRLAGLDTRNHLGTQPSDLALSRASTNSSVSFDEVGLGDLE